MRNSSKRKVNKIQSNQVQDLEEQNQTNQDFESSNIGHIPIDQNYQTQYKKNKKKHFVLIIIVVLLSFVIIFLGQQINLISSNQQKSQSPNIKKQQGITPQKSENKKLKNQNIQIIPQVQPPQKASIEIPEKVLQKPVVIENKLQQKLNIPQANGVHQVNQNHRHEGLTFGYSTVGIRIPGNTYNATKVADKDLAIFDDQINRLFKPYNDTDCQFVRYGDMRPGAEEQEEYVTCKNFIYKSEAIINIGINGFDNFGCQVSTEGNIPNYQYDCTNAKQTPCGSNQGLNKMNNICLGSVTQKGPRYTFYTLEDIIKAHNLQNKHFFLKINCQGCQFQGLKYFPVEKLEYIDQIVGQIHLDQIYKEEWGILDIFRTLTDKFIMVNWHMNNQQCRNTPIRHLKSTVFEFNFVNKRLITLKSLSQSYKQHSLNKPNEIGRPDCQMSD